MAEHYWTVEHGRFGPYSWTIKEVGSTRKESGRSRIYLAARFKIWLWSRRFRRENKRATFRREGTIVTSPDPEKEASAE